MKILGFQSNSSGQLNPSCTKLTGVIWTKLLHGAKTVVLVICVAIFCFVGTLLCTSLGTWVLVRLSSQIWLKGSFKFAQLPPEHQALLVPLTGFVTLLFALLLAILLFILCSLVRQDAKDGTHLFRDAVFLLVLALAGLASLVWVLFVVAAVTKWAWNVLS